MISRTTPIVLRRQNVLLRLISIGVLAILALPAPAQTSRYFTSNGKKIDVQAFDKEVIEMLNGIDIPAASIGIIENNTVVYARSYGSKNVALGQQVTPATVFEAASLSKMLLLFVVQELVDQKKIDLDKPMYQYLPYEPLQHDSRYKLITPRMALSHTSGIENWKFFNKPDTLEIIGNPGGKFVYSGEGYQYLAKVVEKILNEPYDTYVSKRIVSRLGLKNTHLKFSEAAAKTPPQTPTDYAIGYKDFGKPVEKWKNLTSMPASGTSTNAQDYARFIVAMFNGKYVKKSTVRTMLQPVVPYKEGDSAVWVGQGFFTMHTNGDTIAFFNGLNDGFRSGVFYSTVYKRGFVFFTNSDRGELITGHLARMTTGFNLNPLFATSFYSVYPSQAISLMHLYQNKGEAALLGEVERLKKANALQENTLNELGDTFMSQNKRLCRQLLDVNIGLFPQSSLAYCLLGGSYFQNQEYREAYTNLKKAKELGFAIWDIDGPLREASSHVQ